MRNFSYVRANSLDAARQAAALPGAMLLAGGTTLIDLAKCGVAEPETLVDIAHLKGLDRIEVNERGATIGALARMSHVADHADIKSRFPAVSEALWQAASAQIRNMATIGGNLMQRTRCPYFRDPANFPACNKREPGSGCSAIGGVTRGHAVLGISDACIAMYPGDLAVALVAFDAIVHLGERHIPVDDFFLLPGTTPDREHAIEPGEMITAIEIPGSASARRSTYLKIRDRQSYEFAAASAAVGIEFEPDGRTIRDLRVALGGVATKPWRARAVENALKGKVLEPDTVRAASLLAVEGSVDHGANHYKVELAPRVVARAIRKLGETA
ncbi:xanthine dehydrogenase family protein subunit M [Mesorhizobium sp. M7A.F.Ca.CA.001.09.2.1]|uniref:Xanthine dehydrogenase family protein subunit M n=2 Tax=Mesorhizobium TaxID=68287 RepID=A0AB38T2H6_9HYPH|nr:MULTISPECIES: xanthine dehydrogenase family protein subunit M [Mesorhizobium]MDF3212514.1 xanthine dehydrogenase family protein subunit M [Mesorhizobium ciceri]RUY61693.1 xanthine dehydrogenase family protein subunit M [Mesorhizobium sp. M7A.F.Ca.CA.001.05.1.1]RUY69869.1 xanthine dehydrogenase family protein subunit M [Mesorhizobium sp. M7A.F.Ca.CA.001.13.1.1]RUY75786.1 xanthine dehydrogenase family protein subunit M [Mesorhizobium sp. M7A.F.Ca.CA.001.09.2.1]RUZ05258.1 xanthine dehydrogenas